MKWEPVQSRRSGDADTAGPGIVRFEYTCEVSPTSLSVTGIAGWPRMASQADIPNTPGRTPHTDRMCIVPGEQPVTLRILDGSVQSITTIPANAPPYDLPRPAVINVSSAQPFTLFFYDVVDYDRLFRRA